MDLFMKLFYYNAHMKIKLQTTCIVGVILEENHMETIVFFQPEILQHCSLPIAKIIFRSRVLRSHHYLSVWKYCAQKLTSEVIQKKIPLNSQKLRSDKINKIIIYFIPMHFCLQKHFVFTIDTTRVIWKMLIINKYMKILHSTLLALRYYFNF